MQFELDPELGISAELSANFLELARLVTVHMASTGISTEEGFVQVHKALVAALASLQKSMSTAK